MSKWKFVPEEPTEEMCKAAVYDTSDDCGSAFPSDYESTIENYKSMLAAAPSPPATAKDGVSERKLPEDIRDFIYHATLELQQHRSTSESQKDTLFQRAYRLYAKYDVEGLRKRAAYKGKEEGK